MQTDKVGALAIFSAGRRVRPSSIRIVLAVPSEMQERSPGVS
jgi:hypothetical protein